VYEKKLFDTQELWMIVSSEWNFRHGWYMLLLLL